MTQTEQRAQRLLRLESFYDGLDSVDAKLDTTARGQFQQMVGMAENGQEARAQAVNKAYIAYTQPGAREAIETQWPHVRGQVAKTLGLNKPEVTDTELYGALGVKVKAMQDERLMGHELSTSVQLSALEGGDDWLTTYQNFTAASLERPGFDARHSDDYRRIAEASGRAIAQTAHIVGPVVKEVAGLLLEAKNDANPLATEEKTRRREAIIDAIMRIDDPKHRSLAMQLAAAKVGRENPETERGGLEKGGTAFVRGVLTLSRGLKNTAENLTAKMFAGEDVQKMLGERRQVWRELAQAYDSTADPLKGANVVTQGLMNISGMIPQLGLIANPLVGVPLLLASSKDQRQGALQAEGVPEDEAAKVALVQGSIDTALAFVTSNMVLGRTTNLLATSSARSTADLLKRVATIGGIELGVLGATTVAEEFSPLIIQDLAASLSESVPDVNWERELAGMKHALPETIATLLPLVLLGTGAASFRESAKFRDYTGNQTRLKAVGFTEAQAEKISGVADPLKREDLIREEWPNRPDQYIKLPEETEGALRDLDAEQLARAEESATGITTNSDGTYKVETEDGATVVDHIADPAEAQRVADELTDRQTTHAKEISKLIEAIELVEADIPASTEITAADRAAMRAEEEDQGMIDKPVHELSEWIKGRLPHPEDAAASGDALAGELRGFFEEMVTRNKRGGKNVQKARAFFAKKGSGTTLDNLAAAAREDGFNFETPADLLNALADSLKGIKVSSYGVPLDAMQFGVVAPGTARVGEAAAAVKGRLREIFQEIAGRPAFTNFKQALNRWVGAGQIVSLQIRKVTRQVERAVPDKVKREGITAWLQADGNQNQLKFWAARSTKLSLKKGYEAALKLTPEEIKVAERIRDFYQKMLAKLQAHGLLNHGVQHYVSQIWEKEPIAPPTDTPGPKLVTDLTHAKQKTFGSYFEGEQLDFMPVTKDISKLLALYANAVSKVISTRQLVKDLTKKKARDGRPLAAPFGNRALSTAVEGEPALIKPLAKDADTFDYRVIDNEPSLTQWKWIGEHEGADAYLEGQLGLHPEIYTHMRNALGTSGIRKWYKETSGALQETVKDTVKLIDHLGQVTKGTMLSLSPFHIVQEGTHGIGHLVNPFYNMPELNPSDPAVRNAVNHGLMLAGDNEAMRHFQESVEKNLVNYVPVLGDFSKMTTEWMFHEYIPALKLKTYIAIRERNAARYQAELGAKKITQGEIDYLSAQQANAAYGHLNYADIGRNPTFQHFLQIGLLAPDFLEARARFAGQAFKGVFTRAGQEQLKAFAVLGVVQYMTSRILSKLLDDDWHFEEENLFSVVVGNRKYTMRSVPEDLWKLMEDPRRFSMGRISPLIGRGIFQLGTGKNWRGEKVDYTDTFLEMATGWVPIALRGTPLGRELTHTDRANPISPWEQFVGSVGIHISRKSPIAKAYQLAGEFKKKEGVKEDTGTYPVSKYQQLRYALEDGDPDKAAAAVKKLRAEGAKDITGGFHQSIFKPFTGSGSMDAKFKASLEAGDRELVEHAERARAIIWTRYTLLQQRMAQPPAAAAKP